jgi:hypothetical protein
MKDEMIYFLVLFYVTSYNAAIKLLLRRTLVLHQFYSTTYAHHSHKVSYVFDVLTPEASFISTKHFTDELLHHPPTVLLKLKCFNSQVQQTVFKIAGNRNQSFKNSIVIKCGCEIKD